MANLAPLHNGSRRSFVVSYLRPSSEEAGSKTLKIDSPSSERLDGYSTISIRVDKTRTSQAPRALAATLSS
jgi:hypothetical protein